jgi:hypothetical protein
MIVSPAIVQVSANLDDACLEHVLVTHHSA